MKGSSTGEHFDSAYKLQAQLGSAAALASKQQQAQLQTACAETQKAERYTEEMSSARPDLASPSTRTLKIG
eukprot:4791-Heterococcus_DN1.PRE.1